jgi:hypothetical protein
MTTVFDALPGIEVPVSAISSSLARLWEGSPRSGGLAPSEFRASQMNLVLHLGLPTQPADALEQFNAALRFTQRYPARIIVLCPRPEGGSDLAMRAKIYSECFLGPSRSAMSCIEAVALTYPQEDRAFLEDQISIIVEADLPIYYWVHRMSQVHKISTYEWLLRNSRRFLFDTAVSTPEAATFPWPRPDGFRDLARARLLPVRQSIGQFLSAFSPEQIGRDLNSVILVSQAAFAAEGQGLLAWTRERLVACGAAGPAAPAYATREAAPAATLSLELTFAYADRRYFHWCADFTRGGAAFDADLGGGRRTLATTAGLLPPEAALGEAIFY